jgi:predicted dehydrogenase
VERDVYGLGMVGAGGFGRFCLQAYKGLPSLKLVAVCDTDRVRLENVAGEFGLTAYTSYEQMLADPAVHIVAVNTPPASHAMISIAAMQAGKHVFCEKPLATTLRDAEAVLIAARDAHVALSVDYVMRPNPLYRLLKKLGELQCGSRPIFGSLRRFSLENFAADENLGPDHWFWDERVSGGIFVEHGVHFFDLFGWQLGHLPERVVATETKREGQRTEEPALSLPKGRRTEIGITDTVQATMQYNGGATGSFYHAFTRAKAAEHQGITFGWDWATAQLQGWIALDLDMEALVDDEGLAALGTLLAPSDVLLRVPGEQDRSLPGAKLEWHVTERFPENLTMRGHGEDRRITAGVQLHATLGGQEFKMVVYEQCVRSGMSGLVAAIRQGVPMVVPAADLWASTATAIAAREAAASHQEVAIRSVLHWLR